eukprot:scaffold30956_cov61-Phaeocystis_antarctica.AAC.5
MARSAPPRVGSLCHRGTQAATAFRHATEAATAHSMRRKGRSGIAHTTLDVPSEPRPAHPNYDPTGGRKTFLVSRRCPGVPSRVAIHTATLTSQATRRWGIASGVRAL